MRLSEANLQSILALYGRPQAELVTVMSGYRNHSHIMRTGESEYFNLIAYKAEAEIAERVQRINQLSSHIAKSGLPVRRPLDDRIIQINARGLSTVASLYNYLPGETVPWEAYRRSHIKLLGITMARLHAAGADFGGPIPSVIDEYQSIAERMERYFKRPEVVTAMRDTLSARLDTSYFQRIITFLEACRVLPETILHMDLVRSNILFRKDSDADPLLRISDWSVSGILDFEKAALGHPLFDIARTHAFLLVDCPLPPGKLQKYLIDSGYRKHGRGTLRAISMNNRDVLEELIGLFLVYDYYKFLRNTPYESLSQNHHYNRTAAILRAKKMVH